MKITRINQFFRKIGTFQIRYRWFFILFSLILLVVGITGLQNLPVASSDDEWFDDSEQISRDQTRFEEQFGNNETIALLIESNDVFHPEVLTMVHEIGQELLFNVPYADKLTSLTELEVSVGSEWGMEVINPFGDGIPQDTETLNEMKELILSRPSLVNKVVSADATETWLILSLREYPAEETWKAEGQIDPLFQDGEAAIAIATNPKWQSDLYSIKGVGMPYTEVEEKVFFGRELMVRVGTGFLVMLILLIVFLRSLRGVLVPVYTTVSGIIVVFGVMGWLGIEVDSNLMTLPVLLGMALSVGYSIHLVNNFKRFFRETGKRKESAARAVEETGWPLFFTAITTIGSVLSFITAGLSPIAWLGMTCAAVVLTDFLFVMLLIPILMSFGKDRLVENAVKNAAKNTQETQITPAEKRMRKLGDAVLRRKRPLLILFTAAAILLIPGIFKIQVNMDMFEYMGEKVPYIKRIRSIVDSQLGSYLSYNITIDLGKPDSIKEPENLRNFESLLATIGEFELTKKNEGTAKIFSILDIIKEMNQTLNEDDPAWHRVPDSREMAAQLLFLYELSGGENALDWINEEYSMLRAQVEVSHFNANQIATDTEMIRQKSAELFPGARIALVGSAIRFAAINEKIVLGELRSFLTALIVIGILLMLVFGSVKTGLIGLIPNLTPLIVTGGFMDYGGHQLDMMSMTIVPMLLGIAVDDTIHFINHIKYEFEIRGSYRESILRSFSFVGKTLTMTTIILSATFAAYILSPVAALGRIGLLACTGLISALAADFIMTPILIFMTRPFGKEIQGAGNH